MRRIARATGLRERQLLRWKHGKQVPSAEQLAGLGDLKR
jgi:transcriptional regulator with XRE-family HTH domain